MEGEDLDPCVHKDGEAHVSTALSRLARRAWLQVRSSVHYPRKQSCAAVCFPYELMDTWGAVLRSQENALVITTYCFSLEQCSSIAGLGLCVAGIEFRPSDEWVHQQMTEKSMLSVFCSACAFLSFSIITGWVCWAVEAAPITRFQFKKKHIVTWVRRRFSFILLLPSPGFCWQIHR